MTPLEAPTALADYLSLMKPRLSLLVLATTSAGYLLAGAGHDGRFLATLVGTFLVVGGANALNQVHEREIDSLMRRTRNRALPAGRLWVGPAATFGIALALVGNGILVLLVSPLAAVLSLAGFGLYVFVYTPLKRITWLCTLVGAVPGAIPPMIGWAAATGRLNAVAAGLFGILFVWQMPHFLAIARLFRDDYAQDGMMMVGVRDGDETVAYRHMAAYCVALVPISMSLTWLGATGGIYMAGAALLSTGFLGAALRAGRLRSRAGDRGAFLYSLLYLPLLLMLMLLDRGSV